MSIARHRSVSAHRAAFAFGLFALAALPSALSACGGAEDTNGEEPSGGGGAGGSGGSEDPGPERPEKARVRVVHAAAGAPAVDVYAKGTEKPLFEGLVYGSTSEYLALDAGTYGIEVRASPSTAKDKVVYATSIDLSEEGGRVTAIAAGVVGSTSDSDKFRVLSFSEGFGAAGTGNAVVRVVHAGADAPSVGIDIDNDDPGSPEVTGIDRFTASAAAGFPMSANRRNALGIVAGGARVTAFTTPELSEGAELFVIATGSTQKLAREADGFALLAVGPQGTVGFIQQDPIVYALHDCPDAPAVDAFAGTTKLVDGVVFGGLAAPVQVQPGSYDLDFFAHSEEKGRPTSPPAASAGTGELEAGQRYLALATGFLAPPQGKPGFRIAAFAEGFALDDAANMRVRVVHGSPDAPAVDVGVLNAEKKVSPVLVAAIAFGSASEKKGIAVSPGTVPLGVAPAGDDATIAASFHVPSAAAARVFAVAAGSLAGTGQSFRLLAVDTSVSPWTAASVSPQP